MPLRLPDNKIVEDVHNHIRKENKKGSPLIRSERLQVLINHSNVFDSRGVEHTARVPKEYFCANARMHRQRVSVRRAAHYAWKHSLPKAWAPVLGYKNWRTVSEAVSCTNAAAWHWLTEESGLHAIIDPPVVAAPEEPVAAAPDLSVALLSCVLQRGLLVRRCLGAAQSSLAASQEADARYFASFGHATWGGLGWPLLRKEIRPDCVHFEFDPCGQAEWLHVIDLDHWQSVPFEAIHHHSCRLALRQTSDAKPIMWGALETDHCFDHIDLLFLAEQRGLTVDAGADRRHLLRILAESFTTDQQGVEAIEMEHYAERSAASALLEDPLFATAYDDLAPDDQKEFEEVRKARERGRIRKSHAAFQARRMRARAKSKSANAKAKPAKAKSKPKATPTPTPSIHTGPTPAIPNPTAAPTPSPHDRGEEVPIGLQEYGLAPARGSAKCLVCSERIQAGDWRFDYRMKKSTSLRDQRRVHQTCIGELPEETRSSDLLKLKRWLGDAQEFADPGADSIVAMLMASVASLEGGGAPAPSGGAPPDNVQVTLHPGGLDGGVAPEYEDE